MLKIKRSWVPYQGLKTAHNTTTFIHISTYICKKNICVCMHACMYRTLEHLFGICFVLTARLWKYYTYITYMPLHTYMRECTNCIQEHAFTFSCKTLYPNIWRTCTFGYNELLYIDMVFIHITLYDIVVNIQNIHPSKHICLYLHCTHSCKHHLQIQVRTKYINQRNILLLLLLLLLHADRLRSLQHSDQQKQTLTSLNLTAVHFLRQHLNDKCERQILF